VSIRIRRRKFIAALGGAAAWVQAAAGATGDRNLHSGSPGEDGENVAGFLKGLGETGFVEGRNVAIEHRRADNRYDRFPTLAADLVRRRVEWRNYFLPVL
jgi:putative ABC transport system substrate-binding protein